jgi:1,4-dihydroxy-2-naphthoate octaprenyltransferase
VTILARLQAWVTLSRPPFHLVGLLPYLLGAVLARRDAQVLRGDVLVLGAGGVLLTMLATYYAGEYWDYVEDSLTAKASGSRFAGGSQVVQDGLLPRQAPLIGSFVALALALAAGIALRLVLGTGPLTVPLAVLGLVGGFFYSTRPVRWVSTGVGELWIAFCYGWLPVAAGYYLQVGRIAPLIQWIALPIGMAIFNVILLNEFPDFAADTAAGKRNLTVRLGRQRAAWLYGAIGASSWAAVWLSVRAGAPRQVLFLYLPVLALSWMLTIRALSGDWRRRHLLERMCALTIVVNLGTTAAYIAAYLW